MSIDLSIIPLTAGQKERLEYLQSIVGTREKDCIEWPYGRSRNYSTIWLGGKKCSGKRILARAHGIMARFAHGSPKPSQTHCAHRCGNRGCVNPNHLYWATPQQNADDRIRLKEQPNGEELPQAKLKESDVREIRASNLSQPDLAEIYGVSQSNISMIITRKRWKHI